MSVSNPLTTKNLEMKRTTSTSEPIPVLTFPDDVTRKAMYLGPRQVPEIDGSQGGFIAVIVALSVLIVVCCAAVFYLLRHHEPTDQDRAARRERYLRAREQTLHSNSSFSGPSSSTTFGSGSLGDQVKRVWQNTIGRGRGGGGRRGGRGWVRAGSDDEWAPHHEDHDGGSGGAGHPDLEFGSHLRSLPVLKQDARRDGGGSSGVVGGDRVRVIESPLSDAGSGFAPGYTYTDPFSKTTSDVALQRSQSPLSSSPTSSPRERASIDESPRPPASASGDDHRHRLTMSNGSVWTHAGSKFFEDI